MAQHRAARGERSWRDCIDEELDLERGWAPEVVAAWQEHQAAAQHPHPQPQPRPRRAWSAYDFAAWASFLHPSTGTPVCGCGVHRCGIRAHLELVDWGPLGHPTAPPES